jgi:gas vesicle protein
MTNKREKSLSVKDFIFGALLGGLVGSAAAVFLAPKSGREMRQDLGEQTVTLRQKSSSLAQLAKEKSGDLAKTVGDQSSNVVTRVKEWQMIPKAKDHLEEDTIEAETLRELRDEENKTMD